MSVLQDCHTVEDFAALARRRLPDYAYDFIAGGAGRELALARNQHSLDQIALVPRLGQQVQHPDLSLRCLGQNFALPFGIAPLGLCGLVHPQADLMLARCAQRLRMPYILSSTSNLPLAQLSQALGEAPWFQFYAPQAPQAAAQALARAEQHGCPVLIVTADVAAPGKRLRDVRHRLQMPLRWNARLLAATLKHPLWAWRRLRAGAISFPNLAMPEEDCRTWPLQRLMAWQTGGALDWDALAQIRARWPRKLVLKGVLCAQDALRARALGFDAVYLSNHGGRQLDAAPAPVQMLPGIAAQGLPAAELLLDSGIRSGEDIAKALALGAGAIFLGRPFLYALAAGGEAAVERLVELLRQDLARSMALLGIPSAQQAGEWRTQEGGAVYNWRTAT
ncbi:alpha-hydroxy acid oxidase [Massilia sp. W12]|uniref:alpha-hydroxy acid oxidase n=1 Tax=Massilia sp. W12 TaxID=3126507 RepID=UPI0030D5C70D